MDKVLRPKAVILHDSALIPAVNRISPAPNQFTHAVSNQPFYYEEPEEGAVPAGEFNTGTKVVLLVYDGSRLCRVVDDRGLYVVTAYEGLRPL